MSRFLFVAPPFMGHMLPAASVTTELVNRGHEVIWIGAEEVKQLLPDNVTLDVIEYPDPESYDFKNAGDRGWRGVLSFLEDLLIPLTYFMLEKVLHSIDEYSPDIVVVDEHFLAGAAAAKMKGIPWVTLCTTSESVLPYKGPFPQKREAIRNAIDELQRKIGLEPDPSFPNSPHLFVVFSTLGLVGDDLTFPDQYRFVGPVFKNRHYQPEFPWEWLNGKKLIYISLGTFSEDKKGNKKFLEAAIEALKDFDGQVVISAQNGLIDNPPEHVLVRDSVPQIALLKKADLVIGHGGHNTVCETLAHGIPMILAPMRHDQPEVAAMVEKAGAGLRVRYGIITPKAIQNAVDKIFSDESYAQAAQKIQQEFMAAGGEVAAADAIEKLVTQSVPELA